MASTATCFRPTIIMNQSKEPLFSSGLKCSGFMSQPDLTVRSQSFKKQLPEREADLMGEGSTECKTDLQNCECEDNLKSCSDFSVLSACSMKDSYLEPNFPFIDAELEQVSTPKKPCSLQSNLQAEMDAEEELQEIWRQGKFKSAAVQRVQPLVPWRGEAKKLNSKKDSKVGKSENNIYQSLQIGQAVPSRPSNPFPQESFFRQDLFEAEAFEVQNADFGEQPWLRRSLESSSLDQFYQHPKMQLGMFQYHNSNHSFNQEMFDEAIYQCDF